MDAPVFLQRAADSATILSTKAAAPSRPRFDDDDEPFVETVKHDAAKHAAELVDRYGKHVETHSDARVVEAALWLRKAAAPVLASQDTPRMPLAGSQEMANAFATIAMYGLPEDSQTK